MTRLPDEDALARLIVRHGPSSERTDANPCLDDHLLVGFTAGRLLPVERERVEAHLARCAACQVWVADVIEEGLVEAPVSLSTTSTRAFAVRRWVLVAAAAAVLVAAGLFAVWHPRDRDVAQELVALAHELGVEAPLSRDELLDEGTVRGAGIVLLHPCGKTLDRRPTFRWEPPAHAGTLRLSLQLSGGGVVFERESQAGAMPFPEDAAPLEDGGMYVWSLTLTTPAGIETSEPKRFLVASQSERDAFRTLEQKIQRGGDSAYGRLLLAHIALRRGFLAVAEQAARAFTQEHSTAMLGRMALYQALARIGATEAQALRARINERP